MDIETGQKITEILLPGLDNDYCISAEEAIQLLEQAKYDFKDIGITGEEGATLTDILREMDMYFEILDIDGVDVIKCKTPSSFPQQQMPQPIQPQLSPEETATLYRRIGGVIKSLLRKNNYPNECVPLSDLGQELRNQGHTLPVGEKVSSFLRKEPNQFEIINTETDSYVRLVNGDDKQPVSPVQEPAPASIKAQNHLVSMYNIFDFAYFPDYNDAKGKLAQMAVQDDWFVIPDEAIKDKLFLMDYKLRTRFAILVKAQLQGECDAIKVALDQASFDTGFRTSTGQHIIACFSLNTQRNVTRWQTYEFKEFRVE